MEKKFSENNEGNFQGSSVGNVPRKLNNDGDDGSSEEEESFKSCAELLVAAQKECVEEEEEDNEEADEENKPEEENQPPETIATRAYPPDASDDSDNTFSENESEEIYYSEIENNENDSDISIPGNENLSTNPSEIEISFQRELLNYLGSFFNVESRYRVRDNQSAVNVTEEQLSEYGRLRKKVNKNLKVLGIGSSKDLASSDQNVARNLYYLLAARERGDWTSCRRYSRVVPMWSFERREKVAINVKSSAEKAEFFRVEGMEIDEPKPNEKSTVAMDIDLISKHSQEFASGTNPLNHTAKCNDNNIEMPPSKNSHKQQAKLAQETGQSMRRARDEGGNKRKRLESNIDEKEEDDMEQHEEPKRMEEVVTCERVQRNGVWDIRSAVYGSRWSVRRLGLEARFNAHEGCVNALDFSSGGNWIASGSDDRHIVVTDWQQKSQLSRFKVGHSSNIFQVRFLPGSNDLELVSCSRDSTVRYAALSSTGQNQYSRMLTRHKDSCHKMDVPIDQPCLVISAGEDCRVLGSDVRAPYAVNKICKVDKVPLYTISCNPIRSQEFAVAGKDSRVYIYDRRKPTEPLHHLCPENLSTKSHSTYHVTSVAYSKNGESVLASYNDDDIYLLSVWPRSGGPVALHRYQGHRNVQTVTGVSFYGPQDEYVVSGSNDGHVLIWERDSEALVNWFRADENEVVNVLEPHPFMPILATAGLDHDIKLWSMLAADGQQDRVLPLDLPLLERDAETSRIDCAWRKLDEQVGIAVEENACNVPFNLRNLKVITALNWKMRDESYPYSIDNNLDNLIFMSRRRHGENQFRGIFISDSDSADSYDSIPDLNENANGPGSSDRNPRQSSGSAPHSTRDPADPNRPDGCRSS